MTEVDRFDNIDDLNLVLEKSGVHKERIAILRFQQYYATCMGISIIEEIYTRLGGADRKD